MSHGPLFIVCAREACGVVKTVRRPSDQKKRKYCSHRCAGLVNQNLGPAARQTGAARSGQLKQRRALARVAALTPVEAFRLGYDRGLQSKLRQIRRKYRLVPIAPSERDVTHG